MPFAKRFTLLAVPALLVTARPAAAESTTHSAGPAAPRALVTSTRTSTSNDALGIAIILASLTAGAVITAYGLTFDCGPRDHACHRRASLPLWGGVGLAAGGALVGLSLLEPGRSNSRPVLSVRGAFH